ncbi:peptide deformylase [Breznakiellaceae bacterium SP9]
MEILKLGNELLRQKAVPVKNFNQDLLTTSLELIEMLHKSKGIGLAGPQVGLSQRIFAVHVDGDVPRVFINPSIIETSLEQENYEEGCLSIPGFFAKVTRPRQIKVQAWNEKGRAFTLEATDILARTIQHEYDHLEGVLFIDRIPEPKRLRLLEKYEKKQKV